MTDVDLEYVLNIVPNISDVKKALDDVAKYVANSKVGKAVGGGISLMEKSIDVLGVAAATAAVGTQFLAKVIGEIGGQLGPIGAAFTLVSGSLRAIGAVSTDLLGSIPLLGGVLGGLSRVVFGIAGALVSTVGELTSTLTSFASKAAPGQMRLFTQAVEDSQAVIGRVFVPILNLMTQATRLFGDVLANILPNMSEATEAFSEVRAAFADFASQLRDVLREVGPALRALVIDGLRQLSHWAAVAVRAIGILIQRFAAGLPQAEEGEAVAAARTSGGAAARQAQIGSIEAYQQQLHMAAMSSGGMTGGVPEQQLDALEGIEEDAEAMADSLSDIWTAVTTTFTSISTAISGLLSILSNIYTFLRDTFGSGGNGVLGAASDAVNSVSLGIPGAIGSAYGDFISWMCFSNINNQLAMPNPNLQAIMDNAE